LAFNVAEVAVTLVAAVVVTYGGITPTLSIIRSTFRKKGSSITTTITNTAIRTLVTTNSIMMGVTIPYVHLCL